MRSTSPALAVLGILIVAMIAAALYTTGGPLSARIERRDEIRRDDLARLAEYVRCLANRDGSRLPETISASPDCGRDVRLTDPYTDEPYRYERLSAISFRVCATFESGQPVRVPQMPLESFDPATGCLNLMKHPGSW